MPVEPSPEHLCIVSMAAWQQPGDKAEAAATSTRTASACAPHGRVLSQAVYTCKTQSAVAVHVAIHANSSEGLVRLVVSE